MKLIALACAAAVLIFGLFLWQREHRKPFDDGGVTLATPPNLTCTLDHVRWFEPRADGLCHTDDAKDWKMR